MFGKPDLNVIPTHFGMSAIKPERKGPATCKFKDLIGVETPLVVVSFLPHIREDFFDKGDDAQKKCEPCLGLFLDQSLFLLFFFLFTVFD